MRSILLSSLLLLGFDLPTMAEEPTLCTAAELNDFTDDTRRRYTPFCVTGTVQAVTGANRQLLVVRDESDWTEIRNDSSYHGTPGDKVELIGQAHMSFSQKVDIVAKTVNRLGTGPVESAIELSLAELSKEKHHLRQVITEAEVVDIFPDEIDPLNQFLILKDAEEVLPVAIPVNPDFDPELNFLRNARVRIKGRYERVAGGIRQFSGPFISVDGPSSITVIDPALEDSFTAPPLEKSINRTPKEIARRGKRTVMGEVLAVWDSNKLMVRTADARIVNITLAHGQSAPAPGSTVTVAGYPETDLFRVNLSRAVVRLEPTPASPQKESAVITDLKSVFTDRNGTIVINPESHGHLLRIRGTVLSVPSPNTSGRRLLLASGPHKILVDISTAPTLADDLDLGTLVEVTGRGLIEIDNWNPGDIFPHIRNLVVLLRTTDDLKVLIRPSWWTPLRLLVVISILVAALIGVYIWNHILRKLVNRRGRELYREQVAHAIAEFKTGERTRLAVELHDSLSQTLGGIAFQVAASAKTLDTNPAVARRCIETADKMLSSCRTELRQCLFDLRSDTLEEPDFTTAIRKTLDQLDSNAAISIRFVVPRRLLKDTTAHAILSIIRELTGNALRHGGATEVKVAGCIDNGRLLFSVRDNGRGFDPGNCDGPGQGHFGLEGIRNRLQKLNGTFTIESKPNEGVKATVTMALPRTSTPSSKDE